MIIEKNQNPGEFSPFGPTSEVNWLDWHYCLAGSSKTAPRILIFSIALGAEYSFDMKFIDTNAPPKVVIILYLQSVCVYNDSLYNTSSLKLFVPKWIFCSTQGPYGTLLLILVKVTKFQKQIFLHSFEPKIKRNFFLTSILRI